MKKIAVILGAINLNNQKKLLEGMVSAVKQSDCNLFVFTNYIGSRETLESITVATRIFDLPDLSSYDGVILAGNSVYHPTAIQKIFSEIQKTQIPCVSIDQFHRNMSTIEISSYRAQFEIVDHLICNHNCQNIVYVSGPTSQKHKESGVRLQAFLDVMAKHKIETTPDQIYEGFFTLQSGVDVARRILEKGTIPEAIVCANDDMALGVMETFQNAGYKIPQDIKISGFDNVELSAHSNPSLTTVDQNQYAVGAKAVYEVLELVDGKSPDTHIVSCVVKCRESCGCVEATDIHKINQIIGEKYVSQQHNTMRMTDVLRSMEASFSKCNTLDKLVGALQDHISNIGMEEFYLCLCDKDKVFALPERNLGQNIDILQVNENFTSYINIPLAYTNGEFSSHEKIRTKDLLPFEYFEKSSGNVYYVNQIYYQNCCYGYAVTKASLEIVSSAHYNLWLMEIGVGLENTRKWMLLNDAVDKLNGMWCYDNLTNLYNRSGFYYEAKTILDNFKADNKNVFILFIDADGLKKVNDTLGHEAGDLLIQSIANIVHKNTTDDMLSMRYGGDEFVIFGGYSSDENIAKNVVSTIRQDIANTNDSHILSFPLSVSIGVSSWKATEIDDLSKLIEQADKEMYEEKRAKKKR